MVQGRVLDPLRQFLQGGCRPAKGQSTAGMGEECPCQNQGFALGKHGPLRIFQQPAIPMALKAANQSVVAGGQLALSLMEQPFTDLLHARSALETPTLQQGILPCMGEKLCGIVDRGDLARPWFHPSLLQKGGEHLWRGRGADVEQAGSMVDPQVWILSGASRCRSSSGPPARFPQADGCPVPSVPAQCSGQAATGNPSTNNGQTQRRLIRNLNVRAVGLAISDGPFGQI